MRKGSKRSREKDDSERRRKASRCMTCLQPFELGIHGKPAQPGREASNDHRAASLAEAQPTNAPECNCAARDVLHEIRCAIYDAPVPQPTSEGEERDREKFKEALSDYWREVADNRHDDNDGFETAAFHRVMELWEQARSSREGGK